MNSAVTTSFYMDKIREFAIYICVYTLQ